MIICYFNCQVNIWEERRVFGHAKSIKSVMLGEELPQPLEFSKKRSRSVRIMKRDSRSIKTVRPNLSRFYYQFFLHIFSKLDVSCVPAWSLYLCVDHVSNSIYHFLFKNQKLTIGSTTEKIVSSFHLVLNENTAEDEEMNKCKSAVHRVRKMEKDVEVALTQGSMR